ncbi:Eukaryotic translation initiation factor 3 subunit C like [Melia azedarach]|uniref:Eukaryotic translation initiation factor 3 subunit C like n=1 Tax=Melia azedarach TaxID=155640 RepID=A0ACC1YSZ9_MELAZ|nr:Eukaryotic translation initiation factor 3 subunit C like [Melia azedarach]
MALNDPTKTLETRIGIRGAECGSGESEAEEEELEKLESDVKQMAQKILEYRAALPDQLKNTFASILSAQRPVFPGSESWLEPGLFGEQKSDSGGHDESSEGTTRTEEQQKASEKICLLKDKMSSNMSAMPTLLKRMKECISKIDELDSFSGIIHPAFKKKKPS